VAAAPQRRGTQGSPDVSPRAQLEEIGGHSSPGKRLLRGAVLRAAALLAGASLLGASPSRPRRLADVPPAPPAAAAPARAPTKDEARALLQRQLEQLLAAPPLSSARVSLEVTSVDDGTVLFSRGADEQLNPASNTKLLTAAAVLLALGPEYKFTTEVLADAPLAAARGRVKALYVRGRGDPSLTTERVEGIARDLAHRGLRTVNELVLDDTFFSDGFWGPGWEKEPSDTAWAAPSGALSLNHNSAAIYVIPAEKAGQRARVELEPEAKGYFTVDNEVQTLKAGARKRVVAHSYELPEKTRMAVQGRIAEGEEAQVFFRRVSNPTLYFGYAFKGALEAHGVKVGRVRRAAVPDAAEPVTSYDSAGLGELVREMNKVSSNFMAENLLRTLGAERKGAPGSWPKGIEAAEDALAELGVARGTYLLRNGSGLNDTNRISARQLDAVLVGVWKRFPILAEFLSSLPVAARDGTLRTRMEGTDAAGRLRAKTGTLEKVRRVTTLSGYTGTLSGERLSFAVLVNDWSSGRLTTVTQSVDRLGALLAGMGQGPQRDALLASQPDLTPAERKAKVAQFALLGSARDKKNLPLLRAAARSERDQLVRLVAADALFRTDPDAGGGALLEAAPLQPGWLDDLRGLSLELQLPLTLSVASSLLDLGAEGNPEALARLLALSPLVRGLRADGSAGLPPDPILEQSVSEGLFDVSEAAPEELYAALRAAPALAAREAVTLVSQGLARAGAQAAKSALGQALLLAGSREGAEAEAARGLWALLENRPEPQPAVAASPLLDGGAIAADAGAAASGPAPALDAGPAAAPALAPADAGPALAAAPDAGPAVAADVDAGALPALPAPAAAEGLSQGGSEGEGGEGSQAPAPPAKKKQPKKKGAKKAKAAEAEKARKPDDGAAASGG
jgi:serine-type D-Ala-D-Ala carboxypeptidase/endopeptidase (penicillin-binding protein 4)